MAGNAAGRSRGMCRLDAPSDDDLVAAVARGDEQACRLLMERHLPRMVALARRMLGNRADAEDVAQEVFLRVWTHAERWQPGRAQFGTWLHRVATNLCLDRLRKRRPENIDDIPEPVSGDPRPDENLERRELAERVEAALQALPERQRLAIVLSHFQGLSNIEAAEILEVSVEAVESLLGRARRQLRETLATERDEVLRINRTGA
ncbi:MAG: RNA polymerase sigma factor [Parvibaculum sp.]|uniref:RNA polymerase sigma factor n=1 Tax=Parvibaculum sp. TaxID=2024848 RepID=UPI002719A0C1|nr:RNA polymerase sigma factor [Parvibaculum sp.]MDO8838471.1 RNA polymerase sigma factor [Parvibaculum sp.]